jgi:tetratricopeptide (TPR) repeat protein
MKRRSSIALAAVLLALTSSSGSAIVQPACGANPRWEALIRQGGNPRLPAAAREKAYQEARALCPQDPAAYDDLAILMLGRQDYPSALHWLHEGLAVAPRNPTLMRDWGVALLSAGDPEAALQALKTLPPTGKGEFYLGMAYRALRDHQAARAAFSKSFAEGYRDPYVLYEIIEQDRALHDENQGLRDFRTFYARFPHSAWLHLLLGNAYISRQDSVGAESEYRQAAQLDPKLPLAHFDLGRLAFNHGGYSEALRDFEEEIAMDPTFGEAYLYAGTSLRRLGKNQESIPYLEKAVSRDPNLALGYRELAVAQIEAHQLQRASRTLREGEHRFPKEAAFPAQLARLLAQSGELREAAEQSRQAETLSGESNVQLSTSHSAARNSAQISAAEPPSVRQLQGCVRREDAQCVARALGHFPDPAGNANDWNLEAEALNVEHHEKRALAAVQRAIQLNSRCAGFFITQGRIEQRMGNQTAAIRSFLDAEQLQPGAESPIYYAGMSFFMLGYDDNDNALYDRAARHFETALELNPRDDRAEFMLGVIDSIEFKLADARKNLAEALKMKPRNPYYHLHFGMLLSRTGHPAEGRREMKLAEALDPAYPSTYLRLGDVDAQIGKYEEAREQLEIAVRLNPRLASAYYTLGRVYYRLGLTAKSRAALEQFQRAKSQQNKENDPIGATIDAVASMAPPKPTGKQNEVAAGKQ